MTQLIKPYLILVGVDYSTESELALERAMELAATDSNAELHVVNVVPALDLLPYGEADTHRDNNEPLDHARAYKRLETYVAISVAAFEKKRSSIASAKPAIVTHLRFQAPAQEIAQLASDLEVDLVIVGMHGRGAVSRFFLGSVAESVTRLAPCPVLVFRSKGIPPEDQKIEPPCPRCVEARIASGQKQYWCEQHRERHGQRHTYHQADRMSQATNFPLVSNGTPPIV